MLAYVRPAPGRTALVVFVEERQLFGERQAVGEELLREIERPVADDVAIDVPSDALRDLDRLRVAVRPAAA